MNFHHTNVHLEPKVHERFAYGDLLEIVDVDVSSDAGELGTVIVRVYRRSAEVFGYTIKDPDWPDGQKSLYTFGDLRSIDGDVVLGGAHFTNEFRDALAERAYTAWWASEEGLI